MRVVAGRWGGHRLRAPQGERVRPTTDRVKEAIFSILGEGVHGSVVADLCCGAGGLGIEALSRGAVQAHFIDSDRRSIASVRENLVACGADKALYSLETVDALDWLGRGFFPPADKPWLVLADPPYGSGLAEALARAVARLAGHPGFVAAVLEHGADESLSPEACGIDRRRYGESHITILRPLGGSDPEVGP